MEKPWLAWIWLFPSGIGPGFIFFITDQGNLFISLSDVFTALFPSFVSTNHSLLHKSSLSLPSSVLSICGWDALKSWKCLHEWSSRNFPVCQLPTPHSHHAHPHHCRQTVQFLPDPKWFTLLLKKKTFPELLHQYFFYYNEPDVKLSRTSAEAPPPKGESQQGNIKVIHLMGCNGVSVNSDSFIQ